MLIATLAAMTILALTGQVRANGKASPTVTGCPWVGSTALPSTRADQVLSRMTLAEKLSIVHGSTSAEAFIGVPGFAPPTYAGEVAAIPRLCIPALTLEDGPAGVGDKMTGVTQLPAPVAAAATWDTGLVHDYGAVIGAEQRGKGATVDLGPTVNIVRDPRWGRAFESLGEDPYLTSQVAVAEIGGIQSQGVMAQVKHLAAYNQETFRDTLLDNAVVDQRTLHEIYLPAFAAAVRDAGVASVMCSYNYLNGQPACGSPYLLSQVLKGELGFGGFVTSDWFATMSSAGAVNAGLDMQMPDDCYLGAALGPEVRHGVVAEARLNDMVRRILSQMFRLGLFDHPPMGDPKATVTSAAHAGVARTVAEDGTVLLKNEGGVLPLDPSRVKSIAVIGGDAADKARTGGGGSAAVIPPTIVTPYEAIAKRAAGARVLYNSGTNTASAAAVARSADVAIVFASLPESEGSDLLTINLPSADNRLISSVAGANPHTIVVLNTGSAVAMPWIDSVASVLEAWYPGQQDGDAIAALLFGDVDPSGKLPVTFPHNLSQVPASGVDRWPGVASARYSEGLDVGYRWYDAKAIAPLFPFGFGLTYTSFTFDHLTVTPSPTGGAPFTVSVDVTNAGHRQGSDVVQAYVGDPPGAGEPARQLKAFTKLSLAPGTTRRVSLPLDVRALSHWDTNRQQWVADPGTYTVWIGDSSRDLPLRATLALTNQVISGTPTPGAPPASPGQGPADVTAALSCPADVVAPAINGALSLLSPLSLVPPP
jgi:beta-glucosidase